MGKGLMVKCSSCGIEEEYILGVGMLYSSLASVISNVHWKNRLRIERFKRGEKVVRETYQHQLFCCTKCNHAYSRFWVKLERNDGELFELKFKCPQCKSVMANCSPNFDKVACKKCGKITLRVVDKIRWD